MADDYFELSKVKNKQGDRRAEILLLNKAILLLPRFAELYANRGKAEGMLEDYENALKDYDKAISLDSSSYLTFLHRGFTKGKLKDYKGAMADYDKSVSLNPLEAESYYNRGVQPGLLVCLLPIRHCPHKQYPMECFPGKLQYRAVGAVKQLILHPGALLCNWP